MNDLHMPNVSMVCHYLSRGSADGAFPSACRAAIITEVFGIAQLAGLAVLNPSGLFFDSPVAHDAHCRPGTWHWVWECCGRHGAQKGVSVSEPSPVVSGPPGEPLDAEGPA